MIGTKEWGTIMEEMGIDENTIDEDAFDDVNEQDADIIHPDHFEQDSESASGNHSKNFGMLTRGESYSVFENPNQGGIKQLAL